ncbi:hypothetical protein RYX56_08785 [Alkalihalophilus lindianensis]|uniref:Uncharacterized protein n=1 Tax=Alkalihalophilus lindianensis TaxID=1630542 RepID=A0ABU3XAM1_9BACI|nr:hypothetical protein [Alkalihalophilus lindianensis]MDV2684464.1 hypothetical protein [Alkalihalophilus lindianensis]
MKKLSRTLVSSVLFFSILATGTSAMASDAKELTENYEIDWSKAWDEVGSLSDKEEFGSLNDPNSFGTYSYGNLATGSTALGVSSKGVTSTGKTKGKVISTVTSATTSLRNVSRGITGTGPKKTAIGKYTATSEYTMGLTRGNVYTGVTVHTATHTGILYDQKTSASNAY